MWGWGAGFVWLQTQSVLVWIAPLTVWVTTRLITAPFSERLSVEHRGDDYKQYQKEVGMFLPKIGR